MTGKDWIDADERKPTQADADHKGCVVAWHKYNGTMVTGWHQFHRNGFFTHWQHTPKAPEGFPLWDDPPGKAEPDPTLSPPIKEKGTKK